MTRQIPYLAGGEEWLYPRAGDTTPPVHTKILILTRGGVAVIGIWNQDDMAWLPLPKRNKDKEKMNETNA
jgi:hypothetical protein